MKQMHDDWQVLGSQLNSKTPPQGAQTASQASLLPVQQLAAVCWASDNGESAARKPAAGVSGAALRKLRLALHPWDSTGGAEAGAGISAAAAEAGASRRAKRLSRIVFLMAVLLVGQTTSASRPAAHQALRSCKIHAQIEITRVSQTAGRQPPKLRTAQR
jgi:hypothetical protein